MPKTIDGDALYNKVECKYKFSNGEAHKAYSEVIDMIVESPTVVPQPIVRCKDCKHFKESKFFPPVKWCYRLRDKNGDEVGYMFPEDGFCSYAEKIEEDDLK